MDFPGPARGKAGAGKLFFNTGHRNPLAALRVLAAVLLLAGPAVALATPPVANPDAFDKFAARWQQVADEHPESPLGRKAKMNAIEAAGAAERRIAGPGPGAGELRELPDRQRGGVRAGFRAGFGRCGVRGAGAGAAGAIGRAGPV